MKITTAFTALCIATIHVTALPAKRSADAITDEQVLNFALNLEHLENAFYTEGLKKHSQSDFIKAGLASWARGRFEQIATNEVAHVSLIESVLGSQKVAPCKYNFGDDSIKAFADFSALAETVGTSAYSSAAHLLSNKDYLTTSATILATEARQASWVNSAILKGEPWNTPFESTLDLNQIFTIASGVTVKCPDGNAALLPSGLKPFPGLSFPSNTAPGATVQFNITNPKSDAHGPYYVAFISGRDTIFVPLDGDKKEVTIPKDLYGYVFVVVTNDGTKADDSMTIAGPAVFNFAFDAQRKLETLPI